MKNLFRYAALALMLTAIPFTACKDDDDDLECTEAYFDERATELTDALTEAINDYTQDPSDANCNAFREAYEDYINFLDDFTDCAVELGEDQQEWEDAIDALRAELEAIEC